MAERGRTWLNDAAGGFAGFIVEAGIVVVLGLSFLGAGAAVLWIID